MAVVRDIESEVESAFKTVLAISNDIGAVVPRSWKDGGSARTFPAILVHCSPVGFNEGMNGTQTPTTEVTSYVVGGGGTGAVNGTYNENGVVNSKPSYYYNNTYYIYFIGIKQWTLVYINLFVIPWKAIS